MQYTLVAAAIAIFATGAIADNCKPGLDYCGQTLLHKGDYQEQIDQAISDHGGAEINNGKADLFHCVGGDSGTIQWLKRCTKGCVDAGSGNSDLCR